MANYYAFTRSNYFHVREPEAFKKDFSAVQGDEDGIDLWTDKDRNGNPVFGFGLYGCILGIPNMPKEGENLVDGDDENDADPDEAYENFLSMLQKHISPDDAVILISCGHEKLRYVSGCAEIITCDNIRCVDLATEAISRAREMLNNPFFSTEVSD